MSLDVSRCLYSFLEITAEIVQDSHLGVAFHDVLVALRNCINFLLGQNSILVLRPSQAQGEYAHSVSQI